MKTSGTQIDAFFQPTHVYMPYGAVCRIVRDRHARKQATDEIGIEFIDGQRSLVARSEVQPIRIPNQ
ncbi:MAG: hypothetical protein ACTSY1_02350 [Alphaproteobacteria bacterium]